jgi:hypothetical protein
MPTRGRCNASRRTMQGRCNADRRTTGGQRNRRKDDARTTGGQCKDDTGATQCRQEDDGRATQCRREGDTRRSGSETETETKPYCYMRMPARSGSKCRGHLGQCSPSWLPAAREKWWLVRATTARGKPVSGSWAWTCVGVSLAGLGAADHCSGCVDGRVTG